MHRMQGITAVERYYATAKKLRQIAKLNHG